VRVRTYLVERFLSGDPAERLSDVAIRAQVACRALAGEGFSVRYLGSTLLPGDETCFCLFEGPTEEAVARANELGGLPFERISEAVSVGPYPFGDG
jgi:hypothetical protein